MTHKYKLKEEHNRLCRWWWGLESVAIKYKANVRERCERDGCWAQLTWTKKCERIGVIIREYHWFHLRNLIAPPPRSPLITLKTWNQVLARRGVVLVYTFYEHEFFLLRDTINPTGGAGPADAAISGWPVPRGSSRASWPAARRPLLWPPDSTKKKYEKKTTTRSSSSAAACRASAATAAAAVLSPEGRIRKTPEGSPDADSCDAAAPESSSGWRATACVSVLWTSPRWHPATPFLEQSTKFC